MAKLPAEQLSLTYILFSIFYGPASIFFGLMQTSGGGDVGDSIYRLPNGQLNQQLIDQEFNRAEFVSAGMASFGIAFGLFCAINLYLAFRKKRIGQLVLIVHLSLIAFMLCGYLLVITIMRHP